MHDLFQVCTLMLTHLGHLCSHFRELLDCLQPL